MPKQNCWKVAVKKNRYVKKKYCQKCRKDKQKYYVKTTKTRCELVPRQECRTVEHEQCQEVPYEDCHTRNKDQCTYEKQCRTDQQLKCEKPKPGYNSAPTYGAVKDICTNVPVQKCWKEKRCRQVPDHQCATRYNRKCHKVPSQKCRTVKDKHCTPYTADEPKTHETKTCYWPQRYSDDRFCTRRSDDDVLLDAGTEYSEDVEYLGVELLDQIDYLSVFPGDYTGNPNETHPAAAATQHPWPPSDASLRLAGQPVAAGRQADTGNIDYTQDEQEGREGLKSHSIDAAAPTTDGVTRASQLLSEVDDDEDDDERDYHDDAPAIQSTQTNQLVRAVDTTTTTSTTPSWGSVGDIGGGFAQPAIASFFASQMSQGFQDRRRRRRLDQLPESGDVAQGHVAQGQVAKSHVAQGRAAQSHVAQSHVAQSHLAQSHVAQVHMAQGQATQSHVAQNHVTLPAVDASAVNLEERGSPGSNGEQSQSTPGNSSAAVGSWLWGKLT